MEPLLGKAVKWQPRVQQKAAGLVLLALTLTFMLAATGVLNMWASGFFLVNSPFYCPNCTATIAPRGQLSRAALLEAPADFWPHMNRSLEQLEGRYPHVIKRMCVIGERNSGTNWVEATLNLNFQKGTLPDRFGLANNNCFRHKHWFHFPELLEPLAEEGDLIFVLFRNVVDWLLHFSVKPHHAHSHANLTLEEFLKQPWVATNRSDPCASQLLQKVEGAGLTYYEEYRRVFQGPYAEGPIKDVRQLRGMKVDNFLRIPHWVPNGSQQVILVRYEDLIDRSGQGFRDLIDEVKARFDIEGLCRANGSVPAIVSTGYKKQRRLQINLTALETQQMHFQKSITGTNLDNKEALRLLFDGLDLELESKLGYTYDYLPQL